MGSRGEEESLYGDEFGAGAVLGPYLVEARCSGGGFSTVYRARHLDTGRAAALKVLRSHLLGSTVVLRRFAQEASALQQLRHPHVVEIVEYGELRDGRPFIAMEWLEGRTLDRELAERGALGAGEAAAVMEEIGSALAAAHALGIIHRDLKAQNVMAVAEGSWFSTRLIDFGVAKILALPERAGSGITSAGAVLGTPVAMAPEQIRGEPPDARTDVYACGILLYQLLTGVPPFRGKRAVDIEAQHLSSPVPRASERASVPPALDAVIQHCLEKEPARRPGDMGEFLAELRAAVGRGPGGPVPLSLALYIQPWTESGVELDDAELDALDALLERARAACGAAGLEPVLEGAHGVLVRTALSQADDLGATRDHWLTFALELAERLGATGAERFGVMLTLHVAPAAELLRLGSWARPRAEAGVFATRAAAEGAGTRIRLTPVDARDAWLRVGR